MAGGSLGERSQWLGWAVEQITDGLGGHFGWTEKFCFLSWGDTLFGLSGGKGWSGAV